MKIAIGCDPNAMEFKKQLMPFIVGLGHEVTDFGSDDPIYAHTAFALGEAVAAKKVDRGVLICGTGIGVCIAANKVKGVYAAELNNVYQAQRAQLSNDANVITLGSQVLGIELAKCLVKEYLQNTFDKNSRSGPKVSAIIDYEAANFEGHTMVKKIINKSGNLVGEMFNGFIAAFKSYYEPLPDMSAFIYKNRRKGKVALVIGGGSGHEPMFSGFVGRGLADAAVCGNVFSSPNPNSIYETAKAVDEGKGVLFVYGCYAGDNLNFDMAEELCEYDEIKTAHVRVWDDCASAPKNRIESRRGIAGDVFVIKIAGAACDAGFDLDEVVRISEKARDNVITIGLATSPGASPGSEKPMFELGEDEIEYGMGIHGEQGIERTKMQPAEILVERMYSEIVKEMDLQPDQEIAVLINGLGSTTLFELYTVYYNLERLLLKDNLRVYDVDVNSYCTSQNMGGFSITFLKLDEELKEYLKTPCASPYYVKGAMTNEYK